MIIKPYWNLPFISFFQLNVGICSNKCIYSISSVWVFVSFIFGCSLVVFRTFLKFAFHCFFIPKFLLYVCVIYSTAQYFVKIISSKYMLSIELISSPYSLPLLFLALPFSFVLQNSFAYTFRSYIYT